MISDTEQQQQQEEGETDGDTTLEVKLKSLAINHAQLQDEKNALERQLAHVRGKYSDLEDEHKKMLADHQETKEELEELKHARDEAVLQRQDNGDKLRGLRVDNRKLHEANLLREKELEECNAKLKALEDKVFNSSSLVDSSGERSGSQLRAALEKIGLMEAKLKTVDIDSQKPKGQSRGLDLKASSDEEENENMALLKELTIAKTENARIQRELQAVLDRDLSDLKASHSSMQGGITQASKGIEVLEEGIDDTQQLRQKVYDLEANNTSQKKKNQVLTKELNDTKANLKTVMGEIECMSAEVDAISEQFITTKTWKDALHAQLEDAEKQLEQARILQFNHNELRNEHKKLQETVAKYRAENDEYKERIRQLKAAAVKTQTEHQASEKRRKEKDHQNDETLLLLKVERGDLKTKLGEKDFELQELQYALKKSDGVVSRHTKRIKQLDADLKEARDENENLVDDKGELEQKYSEETRTLKNERDKLKADLNQTNDELQKSQETLEKAERMVDTQRRKIIELDNQVKSTLNDRDDIAKRKIDVDREFAGQQRTIEFERSDLKARIEDLTTRESLLGSEAAALKAAALKSAQDNRIQLELLQGEISSYRQSREEGMRAREELSKELEDAKQTIKILTGDIITLSQQKSDRHAEQENMRTELGMVKRENDELMSRVSNLESQKNKYDNLKQLQNEYERLKQANHDVNFVSRSAARDTQDLSRKLGARDSEIGTLSKQLRVKEGEYARIKDEHRNLKKLHQGVVKASREAAVALSQQLSERKTDIENLKAKLKRSSNENLSTNERMRLLEATNKKACESLEEAETKFYGAAKEAKKLEADLERKVLDCENLTNDNDALQESLNDAESLADNLRDRLVAIREGKNQKIESLTKSLMRTENQLREQEKFLNDAKVGRREMILGHQNETNALNEKISQLEARLDESRIAYSEASKRNEKLDAQLKSAVAEMKDLQEAATSRENHSKSVERKSQISYQRLVDKANALEGDLASAEMHCKDLESKLALIVAERDVVRNELVHARSKLREAISANSKLKASCETAESTLSAITPPLRNLLRIATGSISNGDNDMVDNELYNDPTYIIDRLTTAVRYVIKAHDKALEVKNHLENTTHEARALSDSLQTTIGEQNGALVEFRSISSEDKDKLMAELLELDDTVEKVANDNKVLTKELQLKLRGAEDTIEALNLNNQKLCVTNDTQQIETDDASAKRVVALELSLADKDRMLRQANEETRTLRKDSLSLKAFLEAALEEAKLLLRMFAEPTPESSNKGGGGSKGAPNMPALTRLESIVNKITKEVDNLNEHPRLRTTTSSREKGTGDLSIDTSLRDTKRPNPTEKQRFPTDQIQSEKRRKTTSTSPPRVGYSGDESTHRENEIHAEEPFMGYQAQQADVFTTGELTRYAKPRERLNEVPFVADMRGGNFNQASLPSGASERILHARQLPHNHFGLGTSQRRSTRELQVKSDKDAYVQQRLAKSAASGMRGAPPRPYTSVEELMEPASAGIMNTDLRRNAFATPFYRMTPARSRPQVLSDPEVFNSPFITSSKGAFPRHSMTRQESNERLPTFFRYPFLAAKQSSVATGVDTPQNRSRHEYSPRARAPERQSRAPSRRSVDVNDSLDDIYSDQSGDRLSRLDHVRWATTALFE